MTRLSRRVFLLALLVAAVAVVFASAACDGNCATCVYDICTACKSGYYYGPTGCTSCLAAHCAHCEAVGWCISCEAGYRLEYYNGTSGPTVNAYGKCVNGASTIGISSALIAAVAALAYSVVA